MFRTVRFSINPSQASKAFYSIIKQEMTLPKYKYVDVKSLTCENYEPL